MSIIYCSLLKIARFQKNFQENNHALSFWTRNRKFKALFANFAQNAAEKIEWWRSRNSTKTETFYQKSRKNRRNAWIGYAQFCYRINYCTWKVNIEMKSFHKWQVEANTLQSEFVKKVYFWALTFKEENCSDTAFSLPKISKYAYNILGRNFSVEKVKTRDDHGQHNFTFY